MFLRDDAADKQLLRLANKKEKAVGNSIRSTSSTSTTASSSTPAKQVEVAEAMMQNLIRDLSFWDAIPLLEDSDFLSLLPRRPSSRIQQKREPSSSTRGSNRRSSHEEYDRQNNRQYYDGQNSSGHGSDSRRRSSSSKSKSQGTNDHFNPLDKNAGVWQPLPAPIWKAAVDPISGRTYWYDSVSRRTQWEKPREVRQMEKEKKAQRRKRDRAFFREMENNIQNSLARGELVPGIAPANLEPTGPPLEPIKTPLNAPRVRTFSRMDDTVLAELRHDVVSPEEFHRALQQQQKQPHPISTTQPLPVRDTTTTKPRSSSRGRPPLPGATRSRNNSEDKSRSRSRSRRVGFDVRDSQQQQNNASQSAVTKPRLPPSSATNSNSNGNPKLPPLRSGSEGLDTLAGEHLLDGKNLRAEIQAVAESSPENSAENSTAARNMSNRNHARRNTGGTIYVNDTMSNPNVDSTVKCVCGVFRAHLVQAAGQHDKSPVSVMSKPLDMEIFNDRYHLPASWKNNIQQDEIPSLNEIVEFYQEFYSRSQMEFDTIIMSLIYVERLIKTTNICPGPENWRSILFSCMVLASKVWDDLSMWNVDFSNVASAQSNGMSLFTLQRVNQLELILLKSLGFDVRVPASEYAKYYFLIRTMLMRSGLIAGAAQPLGKEEAKGLENRTSQYQDSKLGGDASAKHDRRTQSMHDYSWLDKTSSPTDVSAERSTSPPGGPVLKDKVSLEQIVSMEAEYKK